MSGLPTVEFHTGVDDPPHFACRLVRKALGQGARLAVTGSQALLSEFDRQLWTFDPGSFLPHVRVSEASPACLARTPVWLLDAGAFPEKNAPSVLVNLGADAPPEPGRWQRIIEIVGADPDEAGAGRQRWRQYEAWGVRPTHHAGSG